MRLEILGTGCAKCKTLEEVAKKAVSKVGGFHEVVKVDDIAKIMEYGVMSTPALVIDGEVKSSGKALNVEEVIELMGGAKGSDLGEEKCGCGGKC
ncbi:MAG: thioredoxin family protein [Campylobacterales bacterium]